MMITRLRVEGFRSLKSIEWEPGALNVVIGPNGSGKSNLLRVLELAAVAGRGGLGKYIHSLGGMEPLVWDGVAPGISFTVQTTPVGGEHGPEQYDLEMARLGTGSTYVIKKELLANYVRVRDGTMRQPFKFLERTERKAVVFDEDKKGLVAQGISEEETLLSVSGGPFAKNRLIPPFQEDLASMAIYHDVRVDRSAPVRKPTPTRAERRVDPDGQNLISVLHTLYTSDRDFKTRVNEAMKAAFGEDFEEILFPPAADTVIQMRVRWKSLRREQPAADLSDGTLRFLFLLAVLGSPSPAPVIAIDEPETGLHPAMLPIVAEQAVEASNRSQVILTTHSPQMLDAFGDVKPTTTVVRWADGETALKTLSGDDLDYWLKEYSLGALFDSGELEEMQ